MPNLREAPQNIVVRTINGEPVFLTSITIASSSTPVASAAMAGGLGICVESTGDVYVGFGANTAEAITNATAARGNACLADSPRYFVLRTTTLYAAAVLKSGSTSTTVKISEMV